MAAFWPLFGSSGQSPLREATLCRTVSGYLGDRRFAKVLEWADKDPAGPSCASHLRYNLTPAEGTGDGVEAD